MRRSVLFLLPLLAGCAARQVALVTPPPIVVAAPVAVPAPSLPPGASPGMQVPTRLADGSFPTPNRQLSPAATLWHLRTGLNVAALACTGAQGAAITAGYNAMLARDKVVLTAAEASYAAEFKVAGGDWRDRYDDAMTRLYNFWSQTPARAGLCAAAERVLAAAGAGGDIGAADELASLDRPFTEFYIAYDAWRTARVTTLVAAATPVPSPPARPVIATTTPVAAGIAPAPVPRPRLELDPSIFADTGTTSR